MPGIDLQRLLQEYAFESVLWIGATNRVELPDTVINIEYRDFDEATHFEKIQGRWDLVIIDEDIVHQPRASMIQTIGCLRDLHARRLIVLHPDKSASKTGILHEDLISLCLKALPGQAGVYYHDLYDYKDTPDWLNNRYWANPENWNKYRW
jgi:hypothetical protein